MLQEIINKLPKEFKIHSYYDYYQLILNSYIVGDLILSWDLYSRMSPHYRMMFQDQKTTPNNIKVWLNSKLGVAA